MNKNIADALSLVREIHQEVGSQCNVQVVVCPPFTSLAEVSRELGDSQLEVGAQNMHHEVSGAYTGEISAEMLRHEAIDFVILGHSERRQYFGETNQSVNLKILAAVANGLKPIYCIGETLDEREAGQTLDVVRTQMSVGLANFPADQIDDLVIAYEPVWAIGTGKTATDEMAQEVHADVRAALVNQFGEEAAGGVRILYGGSMKPDNAAGLLSQPDVDGGLIGGASLTSEAFCGIVKPAIEQSA